MHKKRKRTFIKGRRLLSPPSPRFIVIIVVALFALSGVYMLTVGRAATFTVAMEAEQGSITGSAAVVSNQAGFSGTGAVSFGTGAAPPSPTPQPPTTPPPSGTTPQPNGAPGPWTLKFNEDFNGNSLDLTKWIMCNPSFDVSCVNKNQELQEFNLAQSGNDNVVVSDGQLHLIANKKGGQIWSGMIATGPNKFNYNQPGYQPYLFQYGIYEGRVRFPKGKGFWPSLWMLPDQRPTSQGGNGDWPGSGEYGVVEIAGNNPSYAYYTAHWGGGGGTCGHPCAGGEGAIADSSADFHTYAFEWLPDKLTWYVDGRQVAQVTNPAAIHHHPFYIIANFSVGGRWSPLQGGPDASTPYPASMDIDYLRVWQRP